MATDIESETILEPRRSSQTRLVPLAPRSRPAWWKLVVSLLVLVGLATVAVTLLRRSLVADTLGPQLTHRVTRRNLSVTVTEAGELESANNLDIKCKVAGGSTILWIVDDGTEVKEGDILVKLDSSTIDDAVSQQKITYEKALATYIQAESELAVAEINVDEYLEGTFRQEMKTAQSNVAISEENLRNAKNSFQHAQRLFRKGYASELELDGQAYAVEHAQLQLELHKSAVDVLERFTKPKMLQDLNSKLKSAKAKLDSEKAALELEKVRLERLEAQREGCVIHAEQAGMVIYPETEEWRNEPAIEEGVAVREQQTILQLPDLGNMQVRVDVHESKVDLLQPGMSARVRIQDDEYQGEVISVSNRAEQSSWWAGNIRQFRTIVKLLNHDKPKPGMSADVEIEVAEYQDVLSVPVVAVVQQNREYYCWLKVGPEYKKRSLVLGDSNDKFVVVNDGLVEGDEVVLNPRAVIPDAQVEALDPGVEESEPVSAKPSTAPAEA